MKQYGINEIFYSIQGEGVRAGTANCFVRFSGCNLKCSRDGEAGFDCDTEFTSGRMLTVEEISREMVSSQGRVIIQPWAIFTGGEPLLQVDQGLVDYMKRRGWSLAIETNGTIPLVNGFDWICCSPKTAEHTLQLGSRVDELKYVRRAGQGIPKPSLKANHYLISPAVQPDGNIETSDLAWCINLVKDNPTWRLSVQQHKQWRVR